MLSDYGDCVKLAVVSHSDVTGRHCLAQLQRDEMGFKVLNHMLLVSITRSSRMQCRYMAHMH